jgi:hypothetical protein
VTTETLSKELRDAAQENAEYRNDLLAALLGRAADKVDELVERCVNLERRARSAEEGAATAIAALRKVPIVRLNPGKEGTDGFYACPGCGAEASKPCRFDCYVKAVEDALSDMEE